MSANLSTRYLQNRQTSLQHISHLMANQFGQRPGNYLGLLQAATVICSAMEQFLPRIPQIRVWAQSHAAMNEAERAYFLSRFKQSQG